MASCCLDCASQGAVAVCSELDKLHAHLLLFLMFAAQVALISEKEELSPTLKMSGCEISLNEESHD